MFHRCVKKNILKKIDQCSATIDIRSQQRDQTHEKGEEHLLIDVPYEPVGGRKREEEEEK